MNWLRRLSGNKEFDCNDVQENCSDYVDEELSPSVSQKFNAHMDSCTDCNTFVATFRATVLTIRDLPKRPPSADLQERIQSRIAAESGLGQGPLSPTS